ncbi:MAG TPA: type II toxin-antitoxin system VapC family toxin [Trueperaceae bacterium]|nr:type II toxin-antitoxin system VapC family toxin [Trueperaceae bacterium]
MEYRNVLVDTSVIIDFLRKANKKSTYLWNIMSTDSKILISSVTVFELYSGAITENHIEDLKTIMAWFEVIPLSDKIARRSATIYKILRARNQIIEFRDIFIGATAIELLTPLATLNKKHFERIDSINIIN